MDSEPGQDQGKVMPLRPRRGIAPQDVHHDFAPEIMQQIRRQYNEAKANPEALDSRPLDEIFRDIGFTDDDIATLRRESIVRATRWISKPAPR